MIHTQSLLALRVRKAGRSARLRFGNPNPSSGGDGGGAKALPLGSKELSLAARETSALSAHGANEGPKESNFPASGRELSKGHFEADALPTP